MGNNWSSIPPQEGYLRHQYILVFDAKTYDSLTEKEHALILSKTFGNDPLLNILTEVIRIDDKFVAFRLWMDLPENTFCYGGLTEEEYKIEKDKINNFKSY